MKRYLLAFLLIISFSAYAADRAVLQDGTGKEIGTRDNPILVDFPDGSSSGEGALLIESTGYLLIEASGGVLLIE